MSEDERLQAELAKLNAETKLIDAQNRKTRAELDAQMYLLMAQLSAETGKIIRESRWYPAVAIGAMFVALFVLVMVNKLKL